MTITTQNFLDHAKVFPDLMVDETVTSVDPKFVKQSELEFKAPPACYLLEDGSLLMDRVRKWIGEIEVKEDEIMPDRQDFKDHAKEFPKLVICHRDEMCSDLAINWDYELNLDGYYIQNDDNRDRPNLDKVVSRWKASKSDSGLEEWEKEIKARTTPEDFKALQLIWKGIVHPKWEDVKIGDELTVRTLEDFKENFTVDLGGSFQTGNPSFVEGMHGYCGAKIKVEEIDENGIVDSRNWFWTKNMFQDFKEEPTKNGNPELSKTESKEYPKGEEEFVFDEGFDNAVRIENERKKYTQEYINSKPLFMCPEIEGFYGHEKCVLLSKDSRNGSIYPYNIVYKFPSGEALKFARVEFFSLTEPKPKSTHQPFAKLSEEQIDFFLFKRFRLIPDGIEYPKSPLSFIIQSLSEDAINFRDAEGEEVTLEWVFNNHQYKHDGEWCTFGEKI